MREKGYTDQELFDAGLVKRGKKGGFYDAFRNRLMFPVIDVRGNVIGFSGRILGDGEPKYLNSPETLVFNKSRNLFALNLAKKSKSGYIILSEGNIDVVSLHQAGFDSAVASLGTSLTPEQARLISRYTNEVIIAYDNDGAGKKAAQRAIGILEKLDLKVKVLRMSGAKDPDEFIKLKGAEAFRRLIEGSENQLDYRSAGSGASTISRWTSRRWTSSGRRASFWRRCRTRCGGRSTPCAWPRPPASRARWWPRMWSAGASAWSAGRGAKRRRGADPAGEAAAAGGARASATRTRPPPQRRRADPPAVSGAGADQTARRCRCRGFLGAGAGAHLQVLRETARKGERSAADLLGGAERGGDEPPGAAAAEARASV